MDTVPYIYTALIKKAPFVAMNNVKPSKSWTTPELLHSMRQTVPLVLKSHESCVNILLSKPGKIYQTERNPEQYWKELNQIFNTIPHNPDKTIVLTDDNVYLIGKSLVPNFANRYFVNVRFYTL